MAIDSAVSREELEELVTSYRHALERRRDVPAEGRARRHAEREFEEIVHRFERALEAASADEELRRSWREHLYHGAPRPSEPLGAPPLLFRGRAETGSVVVVVQRDEGELDVVVDGVEVERLDHADELLQTGEPLTLRLGGHAFAESFESSPEALAALRETVARGEAAPAEFVRELVADGLLDRRLGLTPRGRRVLAAAGPEMETAPPGVEVPLEIVAGNGVPGHAREALRDGLVDLARRAPRRVISVHASLLREEDPALERPAIAKATMAMSGRAVRAHVAAAELSQAVQLLVDRLRRSLRELGERDRGLRRAAARAPVETRPEQRARARGRELVRRKTFAPGSMTPPEAELEMRDLDHDFHLFTAAGSGAENVVYRRADGTVGLEERGPELALDEALEALDAAEAHFLFFTDRQSGRGAVVYRRYDGDYGLVTAA